MPTRRTMGSRYFPRCLWPVYPDGFAIQLSKQQQPRPKKPCHLAPEGNRVGKTRSFKKHSSSSSMNYHSLFLLQRRVIWWEVTKVACPWTFIIHKTLKLLLLPMSIDTCVVVFVGLKRQKIGGSSRCFGWKNYT